jgi:hypothetical protein
VARRYRRISWSPSIVLWMIGAFCIIIGILGWMDAVLMTNHTETMWFILGFIFFYISSHHPFRT